MDREDLYDSIPEYAARVDHFGDLSTPEDMARRGVHLGASAVDSGVFGAPIELPFWFNSFTEQLDLVPA